MTCRPSGGPEARLLGAQSPLFSVVFYNEARPSVPPCYPQYSQATDISVLLVCYLSDAPKLGAFLTNLQVLQGNSQAPVSSLVIFHAHGCRKKQFWKRTLVTVLGMPFFPFKTRFCYVVRPAANSRSSHSSLSRAGL